MVELAIKNTFIEFLGDELKMIVPRRRCSSAPPSPCERPAFDGEAKQQGVVTTRSDASTASFEDFCSISDEEAQVSPFGTSENGSAGAANTATGEALECPMTPDYSDAGSLSGDTTAPECSAAPDSSDAGSAAGDGKVTLCLQETLVDLVGRPGTKRTELHAKASAFTPAACCDASVQILLEACSEALLQDTCVLNVHLIPSPMGGISAVNVEVTPGALWDSCRVLELAQGALLEAASHSEDVYVVGYAAQPFQEFGDSGFRAWISRLPAAYESTACWDYYMKGFCPRRATCRWCHPMAPDLMQLVVTVQEPTQTAEEIAIGDPSIC